MILTTLIGYSDVAYSYGGYLINTAGVVGGWYLILSA